MTQTAERSRRSLVWIQGAVAGGVVAVAPGTALLAAVLLCPAIVYYLAEPARLRPVARAMLLCGGAATFLPIRTLWDAGNTLAAALDILGDIRCPLLAWVACGGGWLLAETVNVTARLMLEAPVPPPHRAASNGTVRSYRGMDLTRLPTRPRGGLGPLTRPACTPNQS